MVSMFASEITIHRSCPMRIMNAVRQTAIGVLIGIPTLLLADEVEFDHHLLESAYHGEGAAFGDLNHDGVPDLVSGPFWYEGPSFEQKHTYYPPNPKDPNQNGYTNDNFLVFVEDFNGDDWNDIFVVAFPGTTGHWYENPQGGTDHWNKHLALKGLGNESPTLRDIDQDGHPELFCVSAGAFGYARINPDAPTQPWTFHPVSQGIKLSPFTHGLGLGDLDGDQRVDLLTKDGWYEQPDDLAQPWAYHPFDFRPNRRVPFPGGAQIHAYDIDGDGDQDVVMSLAAHGYGLAWFEQKLEQGKRVFEQHTLLRPDGKPTEAPAPFSQLHALEVADIDGDGLKDLITGKCRFAHGPAGDPDPQGDPVLYWFQLKRASGEVKFLPHLISRAAGVGRQIAIGDPNQNGQPDIAIGNKAGTRVFVR